MKKRILLVEDTLDVRNNLLEFLMMEGYDVFATTNGLEALDYLQNETPDLMITDLLMPEMDGFELIKEVRKRKLLEKIPIIVFSAKPLSKGNEFENLKVNRILLKPCNPDVLVEIISELI